MKRKIPKIRIDKDVPIPIPKMHFSIFPFENLEIGDSFLVEKSWFQYPTLIQLKNLLYRKSVEYKQDTGHDIKLTFQKQPPLGIRVFRIE